MSKCVQIVASLAPEDGGPSYSVPALAMALGRAGLDVRVRRVEGHTRSEPFTSLVHERSRGWQGALLRASDDLAESLRADARSGAILHAHGLWLMPNIYPAQARRKSPNSRLIHSPRGMLGREALKISAWKKRAVWHLLQRRALAAADCLHATAASEYKEIRAAGLRNPVAVIPNGIDLPDLGGVPRVDARERVVLSLGRIHPKKGLDRLIRAWAYVESEFPNWRLRIVGPAEVNHDRDLRVLICEVGVQRVSIEDAIYGDEKLAAYHGADLFILPTRNENFAISVAEALATETPVISTKGAPWAGLETERCGWWVDHGVDSLAAALRTAMVLPSGELRAMGARGRAWMARDFGWDRIAHDMLNVYSWLKRGSAPPATVQFD